MLQFHALAGVAAITLFGGILYPLKAQTFSPVPALSFTKAFAAADPLPQVITITSTGDTLRFNVTASTATGGAWLQVSPQGNSCCYTPDALTVTVVPSVSLAAGTYTGQIVITDYYNSANTMTVAVSLTIVPPATSYFDTLPGQISFFAKTGAAPPLQSFQVRNGVTGVLNWTLAKSTADGGNWLGVSAPSGTTPAVLAVTVTPSSLPGGGTLPGTFIGQIRLDSSSGSVTIPVSVVISDDAVFTQVNPIGFTKGFGGTNPLPQTLTITSTGPNYVRFNVSASTSNGGSWLQVSPQGNSCCYTPEAITVSVNPSASLAAGTYLGQIKLTPYSTNDFSMMVPVTLIVTPAGTPYFDNLPGQLSYSLKTSATVNPAPQVFQVRNAGLGTLGWAVSRSTSDGRNWLAVTPASANAPSNVSVSVTTALLPGGGLLPGTFTGQVVFRSATGTVTVPVAVVVGDSVFQQVNPINFTKVFGGANPLPQVLMITSTGPDLVRYNAVASTANGGAWLQVSPAGNSCCYTPEAMTVTINPSTSLAAGTYTGQITLTAYSSNDISMTVPVTLTIAPSTSTPFFDNMPSQLSFTVKTGSGVNPPSQTMQVRNGGSGTLGWAVSKSTSDGGSWLNVTPATGNAPSTLAVSIVTAQLPDQGLLSGTFTGQLVFRSATSTVTVPVSVTVGESVFRQMNPLSFTKAFGGPNPLPQVMTLTSSGAELIRFNATAVTATGGTWLQVSPEGNSCCYTPDALTVSVNPSTSLAAGTYTGSITLTMYSSNDQSITVPVTLTVAPPATPFFDNLPGELSYSLKTGSATNPPAQTFQIRNGGSGTLTWSLARSTSDGGNWLTVSAGSGGTPATMSVGIVRTALPDQGLVPGTFTGQIVLRSASSTVTIPVTMTVGEGTFSQSNPLSFTMPVGGANPLPQLVMTTNTGQGVLRYNAVAAVGKGGNWLEVVPSGNSCCYTPQAMRTNVINASTLAAGSYTGQLNFREYSSSDTSQTIPVNLTVAPTSGPYFDNMPGQLNFAFQPSSTNPPPQTIQIRNGGPGALNWSLVKTTADGGNWLVVSGGSGTAPSVLTVGVRNANLPDGGLIAGTFTGQLLFRSATGSVTVQVTVTVGTSVLAPVAPVQFSMVAGGANPLPRTFNLTSTGDTIRMNVVAAAAKGGTWLQISPQGSSCCYTPSTITASVTGSTLPAGVYTAEVLVTEYSSYDRAMTIPVILTVSAPGVAEQPAELVSEPLPDEEP